jgi:hypothetical protein
MKPKHLTEAEARTMTRGELVDRIYAEQKQLLAKKRMTDADRAAYDELMRIMHAHVDVSAGLDAALDTVKGQRNDYWETRPANTDGGTR